LGWKVGDVDLFAYSLHELFVCEWDESEVSNDLIVFDKHMAYFRIWDAEVREQFLRLYPIPPLFAHNALSQFVHSLFVFWLCSSKKSAFEQFLCMG
jgi:hypothetical protein